MILQQQKLLLCILISTIPLLLKLTVVHVSVMAYRLIQKNKDYVVAKACNDMVLQYPSTVIPNSAKCKRDMMDHVAAVAYDVFAGGNKYARKFIQEYYSNGNLAYVNAQVTETVWGYNKCAEYEGSTY